jgi:hypothetical protein
MKITNNFQNCEKNKGKTKNENLNRSLGRLHHAWPAILSAASHGCRGPSARTARYGHPARARDCQAGPARQRGKGREAVSHALRRALAHRRRALMENQAHTHDLHQALHRFV